MRPPVVALAVTLAALAVAGRAEDSPPARPAAAPSWKDNVFGDVAVSRDGAWLGAKTLHGYRLFPAAGGDPVALELPKGETASFRSTFTADSKWFVVAGEASTVEAPGIPKDRTQSVFVWSVAAPTKRRAIQITLKAEALDKDVKRYMDPKYRNMKNLKGAVADFLPLAGSRVAFDRGELGIEVWDVATTSRGAGPAALEGLWSCGMSADGSRFVRVGDKGLEVRDAKSNQLVRTIAVTDDPKHDANVNHPRFAPDGADVVAATTPIVPGAKSEDAQAYELVCWSVADGKRRWSAPLGMAKYVSAVDVAEHWAVAVVGDALHLVDLRDGSAPAVRLQGVKCSSAKPSADGKTLWIADENGLSRADLPEPPPK